jgi:hypothetical protein
MNSAIPMVYIHYFQKHETGMYGVMMDNNGLPFAVTLQPDNAYLPEGEYDCNKSRYFKGGYDTFEIIYPGHTRVLFHIGNHEDNSQLCVLIGEQFETVEANGRKKPGIAASGKGFGEFWDKYKSFDKIKLKVSYAEGLQ